MAVNISTVSLVRTLRNKLTSDPPPAPEKILRILQKLTRLPISIEILTETGIGKVVNGFRKHDGEIAQTARGLVRTWKSMVHEAMDEEAMKLEGAQEQQRQSNSSSDSTVHQKATLRVETTTISPSRSVTETRPSESASKPQGSPVFKSSNQSTKARVEPKLQNASPGSASTRLVASPKHIKKRPRDDVLQDDEYTQLKEKCPSLTSGSPVKKMKSHHEHPGNGTASVNVKRENDISAEAAESRNSHGQKKLVKESQSSVRSHDKSHDRSHDKSHGGSHDKSHSRSHDKSHDKSHGGSHDKSHSRSDDKSRDRSHDKSNKSKSTTKTSIPKVHSSPAPHEPQLPSKLKKQSHHQDKHLPSLRTERESQSPQHAGSTPDSKEKSPNKASCPKPKSQTTPEQAAKPASAMSAEKTKESHSKAHIQKGKTDMKSKSVKASSHGSSSESASPRTSDQKRGQSSKSQVRSSGKGEKSVGNNLPKEVHRQVDDIEDQEDLGGQDFRSTGMSFGDCLLGPVVSKVKKVTKGKPSNSVKLGTGSSAGKNPSVKSSDKSKITSTKTSVIPKVKSKTRPSTTSDVRSKVKGSSVNQVKSESSRSSREESDRGKDRNKVKSKERKGTSSSEGHRSDASQESEAGRRHRKKRSISQEDEEAMAAKKLRRESAEVAMSLPEIQPDYKPIRLPEISSPLKKRALTDEEERTFLGSKQGKTKVFSGRARVNRYTTVPKLYDICMDILCDNIDALDEVGGVPYDILHPVLARCTPAQLFHLEDCNPHFLEDSDPLWQKHAQRDFKGDLPGEMESWRELYIRKHDEREARLKSITANISRQMAEKDPGRLTKMAFIDRPAKPPRSVMRQQLRHGTASGAFMPEKRTHSTVQPNRLSRVLINSSGADVSSVQHQRQRKATMIVAPMMMKTLKMIKKLRR